MYQLWIRPRSAWTVGEWKMVGFYPTVDEVRGEYDDRWAPVEVMIVPVVKYELPT